MALAHAKAAPELPGKIALWAGWVLPMLGWAAQLMAGYLIVEFYCQRPGDVAPQSISIALGLLTVGSLLAVLAGLGMGLRNRRRLADATAANAVAFARARFLCRMGLLLGLFLGALVVMQGLPILILDPCQ